MCTVYFEGRTLNQKRKIFFLNKLKHNFMLLCLYVADPATFSSLEHFF